jgi:uncharacterized membrane protein YfcA
VIAGLVLLGGGVAAGVFGSLLGLGGGILIVPLLTLGFGVPLREAVAASLVSVIVTSSAAAAVYLQRHVANLRLGMTLELGSAAGALVGGLVAFLIAEQVLAGLFAGLLIWVAISMLRRTDRPRSPATHPATPAEAVLADTAIPDADLDDAPSGDVPVPDAGPGDVAPGDTAPGDVAPGGGSFTASLAGPGYAIHHLPLGMIGSVFAGVSSALLGVGGGIIKVPVMHLVMGVPLRTSTATSNLMMGITATASAVIYLLRDEIDPYIAGPVALGVFVGASMGSRLAHRVDLRVLRLLFVAVLVYTAVQMASRALGL